MGEESLVIEVRLGSTDSVCGESLIYVENCSFNKGETGL
jgi:hypothetical protein